MLFTILSILTIILCTSATPSLIHRQAPNSTEAPCKLPEWTMTKFRWFNSTHNLDCDRRARDRSHDDDNVRDAAPRLPCITGLSTQPPGYGPPDTLAADITDIGRCRQRNPGSVPPRSIGKGWIKCGGSAPNLFFEGDSNAAESIATVRVKDEFYCEGFRDEEDGRLKIFTANGKAEFAITCSHDEGKNATCISKEKSIRIPVTDWAAGSGRRLLDNEETE